MAVITISRQFGAGGRTLGALIAEKLGYSLIDEVVVEKIAAEAKVSPNWVKSVENQVSGWLSRFVTGMISVSKSGYLESATMKRETGYIDGDIYVEMLHKVIPKIADEDNVVIIGRGGQYILADREDAFHFLLIADLEKRIQFMMENYELSRKEAKSVVEKKSKIRLNLYRYFGQEDYDNPNLYHLVMNMNRVDLDIAGDIVCRFVS